MSRHWSETRLTHPPSQRERIAALSDTWHVTAVNPRGETVFDAEFPAIGLREALELAEGKIRAAGNLESVRFTSAQLIQAAVARPLSSGQDSACETANDSHKLL